VKQKTQIAFYPLLLVFLLVLRPFAASDDYAFVGATVYPSPTATGIPDAVILTSLGKIAAVGTRSRDDP
jgi:hypothetical protein